MLTAKSLSDFDSEHAASRPWLASRLPGFVHGCMKDNAQPLRMGGTIEVSGKCSGRVVKAGRVPPVEAGNQPECVDEMITFCIVKRLLPKFQECVWQRTSAARRDRVKAR